MIPTIIHQIWWQGLQNIPPNFKRNIILIKNNHKQFKYILWDEIQINNLIEKKYSKFKELFEKLSIIQKIDISKYLILHSFGGVYIDMDMFFIKSIEKLYNSKESKITVFKINVGVNWFENIFLKLLGISSDFVVNNSFIISPKNEMFWLNLIESCLSFISNKKHNLLEKNKFIYIFNSTGPFIFTKEVNKAKHKFLIKDYYFTEPCFPLAPCLIDKNTYFIHKHSLSWLIGELSDSTNFFKVFYRFLFSIYGLTREKLNLITFLIFFFTIPLILLFFIPRKKIIS